MSIFQLLLIVLLYFDWNIRQSFDALMEGCCHFCGWCCYLLCWLCCRWCWRCHRICDHSCFLIACLICMSLNRLAYWNSLLASFLQFDVSVHYSLFQELHRLTHSLTELNRTGLFRFFHCIKLVHVFDAIIYVFVFVCILCVCICVFIRVYQYTIIGLVAFPFSTQSYN